MGKYDRGFVRTTVQLGGLERSLNGGREFPWEKDVYGNWETVAVVALGDGDTGIGSYIWEASDGSKGPDHLMLTKVEFPEIDNAKRKSYLLRFSYSGSPSEYPSLNGQKIMSANQPYKIPTSSRIVFDGRCMFYDGGNIDVMGSIKEDKKK